MTNDCVCPCCKKKNSKSVSIVISSGQVLNKMLCNDCNSNFYVKEEAMVSVLNVFLD